MDAVKDEDKEGKEKRSDSKWGQKPKGNVIRPDSGKSVA